MDLYVTVNPFKEYPHSCRHQVLFRPNCPVVFPVVTFEVRFEWSTQMIAAAFIHLLLKLLPRGVLVVTFSAVDGFVFSDLDP